MEKIKFALTNPVTMLLLAAVFSFAAFGMPAAFDYLFDGAILTVAKSALGVTLLLSGVYLCRIARAAFIDGDANGKTAYIVPAVYIAVAIVVASAIISV